MVRLEQVLDSWKTVRADAAAAVEQFPADQFDFRCAPEMDSFGEIARHILNAGDGFAGLLLSGDDNFATPDFRERLMKHAGRLAPGSSPAELAAAMRTSLEERTAQLASQPTEFYSQMITRMDGQKVTRLEMLQMVKEHELTHRAQLFVCLRMKGIVPPTTRRRMAKPASK